MNAILQRWYDSERSLGHEPDEIDNFSSKILGSEDAPALKLRGGESATMFKFVVKCFLPQFQDDIKNGRQLMACAQPLLHWVEFLGEQPDLVPPEACDFLIELALKHIILLPLAGIPYKPKHHAFYHLTERSLFCMVFNRNENA